jgi:uncharacterized protein
MPSPSTIPFNPLRYPLYVLTKPGGAACNLACTYCYYLDKTALLKNGQPATMSDNVLERFIQQYIEAQPGPQATFVWHGGEPLLLGRAFFDKVLAYQRPYRKTHRIENQIQTNGTLIDASWARFFKDNSILVGLSLDGPEHLHDAFRHTRQGGGSFAAVMNGWDLLMKHGVEVNILSVVNRINVAHPLTVYHFFKEIGARYIQFTPVVEQRDGIPSALSYGQFLTAIFDEWVREDVGDVFVTTFDATLAGYLNVTPGICVYAETCGHAAALETNGDLYSCDHYVSQAYKLGNLTESTLTELMLSPRQMAFGQAKADLPSVCLQCKHLPLCRGECPRHRSINLPGESYPLSFLCQGLKHYFDHTEQAMRLMAAELTAGRPASNVKQWMVAKS